MIFCVLLVFFLFAIRIFHAAALYNLLVCWVWDHSGLFFFNEYNWLCLYLKEKMCHTIAKKKKKSGFTRPCCVRVTGQHFVLYSHQSLRNSQHLNTCTFSNYPTTCWQVFVFLSLGPVLSAAVVMSHLIPDCERQNTSLFVSFGFTFSSEFFQLTVAWCTFIRNPKKTAGVLKMSRVSLLVARLCDLATERYFTALSKLLPRLPPAEPWSKSKKFHFRWPAPLAHLLGLTQSLTHSLTQSH